jgi:hypothetical protein
MRKGFAAALLPLALLLVAAKPVSTARTLSDEAERNLFRARGLGVCLTTLRDLPEDRQISRGTICTCALDRYVANHAASALPRQIDRTNIRSLMSAELAACGGDAADTAAAAAAVAGDKPGAIQAPPVAEPPPVTSAPGTSAADAIDAAQEAKSGSWFEGFGGFSLPSFSSLGIWGWAGIGLLLLFFIARRIFRGGNERGDLDGLPRTMTPSAPSKPRPPNLPPRG